MTNFRPFIYPRTTISLKKINFHSDMTICIAAIAESNGSPKILMCADRMVSGLVTFEHLPKITQVSSHCWVMLATEDLLQSKEILEKAKREVRATDTIAKIADKIGLQCELAFEDAIDREVMLKFGSSHLDFARKSKQMNPALVELILKELEKYNDKYRYEFSTSFVVAGMDPVTLVPHIYVVNELGKKILHDSFGFAVVGSGSQFSFPEMAKYKYTHKFDLSSAVVCVYAAKKASERTGSIGKTTDLVVMHLTDNKKRAKPSLWIPTDNEPVLSLLDQFIKDREAKEEEVTVGAVTKLLGLLKTAEAEAAEA